jgi:hypothetical protein
VKVHAVMLFIVDHDNLGADEIQEVLENQRYPNHCIRPSVMRIDTREVEWTDQHPLNVTRTMRSAFEELFTDPKEKS